MHKHWIILACLVAASCGRAQLDEGTLRLPIAKEFRVNFDLAELRGTLRPFSDREADADVVLYVNNPSRGLKATYRYRVRVRLGGDDAIELAALWRHMYAVYPRQGHSWRSLLASAGELTDGLEVVRLDGAGEEG